MRYVRSRLIALTVLAPWLVMGCAPPVEDSPNPSDGAARRVVALIPSINELILALGGGELLVGRTDFDSDSALAHLPSVGGGLDPSLETLVGLEPDLVIMWEGGQGGPALAPRLEDLGIAVRGVAVQTLEDTWRTIRDLGDWLDLEAAADSLATTMQRDLAAIRAATAAAEPANVLYVVWDQPPMTTGSGTFVHQLIEIAGGRNVFGDLDILWPSVSIEAIVARAPDVIVWPANPQFVADLTSLSELPGWRDTPAVRNDRVATVDSELFNRPGPRLVEAARALMFALHPDLAARTP